MGKNLQECFTLDLLKIVLWKLPKASISNLLTLAFLHSEISTSDLVRRNCGGSSETVEVETFGRLGLTSFAYVPSKTFPKTL